MRISVKISLLVFSLFFILNESFCQYPLKIRRKYFKKEEYGFKEAWKAVKKGEKLFSLGEGSYRDARESYLKAYEYNPGSAELNYMIGKCYLFTDNKFESIKYIQKAYEINPHVSYDIRYMLGMAYHQIYEFDLAIQEYTEFQKKLDPKIRAKMNEEIDMRIKQARNGRELVDDPKRVVINNLGQSINSIYDEYAPVVARDGSIMYFTSRRQYDEKSDRSILDNKYFEDIYYSVDKDGDWVRARRLDKKITTNRNNHNIGVIGLSPNKDKIYIYKGKQKNGDIYVSEYKKGKWTRPRSLSKFNSRYKEMSICVSSDESTVYFASSNAKYGMGGTDIYYSKKNEQGRWEKPKSIGNIINTIYNEVGVNLSPNDSILYFSSEGHNSMGGFDVFKSEMSDVGLWTQPVNLGYPINTANDDVFYTEMPDKKTAYYSSIREAGIGGQDIYKIIYLGAEKDMLVSDKEELIAGLVDPMDDIYFIPTQRLDVDTSLLMRGFITDSETKEPIIAKLELIDTDQNRVVATSISDSTGNYKIRIPDAKQYGIEIVARGYLFYLDVIDVTGKTYDEVIVRNFELDRVEVGAKVVLQNIYFETGKATLKPESYTTLNSVVKLMRENPTLRLEISGHTDNVGSLKLNTKLSGDRAKSVVNYLVKQGINSGRLTYIGYAYNQPIAPNTTAEGRAKNRRVEFKVLSK